MWQQFSKFMVLRRLGIPLGAIALLLFLYPRKSRKPRFFESFAFGRGH